MDAKQPTPATGGEISSRVGIRFYRYRGIIKRYWWVLAITVGLGLVYEAWVLFNKPTRYISYGKLSVRETGGNQTSLARTTCLLYTSPSPRDRQKSRMPSSA